MGHASVEKVQKVGTDILDLSYNIIREEFMIKFILNLEAW